MAVTEKSQAESQAETPAEPAAGETAAATSAQKLGVFNQLLRFVTIGGFCALIDSGTYAALLWLSAPFFVAKSVSFIFGTTASYFINRKFTFSGASTGNAGAKAGGFALVYVVTFFVNVGTNELLVHLTGAANSTWLIAMCWIIAQGLGTLINFIMLRFVVFKG